MTRKFSLVHLTRMDWTPPELIYNAALCGYDYVSPRTINRGAPAELVYDLANDKELFKLTEQAIKDTGVKFADTELVKINDSVKDINEFAPDLEAAARLGVRDVTTNVWTPNKEFYTQKFAELCDLAAQFEMTVSLEFVTWSNVRDLKETLALFKAAGRKNARVKFDLLHTFRSRVTLAEIAACPKELIAPAIHACDAVPEIPDDIPSLVKTATKERLYLGEGGIYVAETVKLLPESTIIGLELPNAECTRMYGPVEHARRCLATAKKYFADHGII